MALKAGRGSDQFMIRLPDGMRERLREEAEKHGRSMNAETVDRLIDSFTWPPLFEELESKVIEQERRISELTLTLEAERDQTEQLRDRHSDYRVQMEQELAKARRSAELASAFRDDMAYMSKMLRQMHEEDRVILQELDGLVHFLEADRVRLEARVNEESLVPRTQDGPGPLKSRLAQRFAWSIDQRMGLVTRLITKLSPKDGPLRRAHVAMHDAGVSATARELAEIYIDEGGSSATEFHDYISGMIESQPESKQGEYRLGLREVMPRIFPEWSPDDHPLFD